MQGSQRRLRARQLHRNKWKTQSDGNTTTTLQWQPNRCFCKPIRDPWMGWRGRRGGEVDGSIVAWLDPHKYLYMETSCVTRKTKPITYPYRSHMGRYPKISKTLSAKPSQQRKIPTLKGFWFTTHHYLSTIPPLLSGTQKIPSSLIKEFINISHLLTWPSEGSWQVPHQCLLLVPLFLLHRYPLEWFGAYNSLMILAHHQLSAIPRRCHPRTMAVPFSLSLSLSLSSLGL